MNTLTGNLSLDRGSASVDCLVLRQSNINLLKKAGIITVNQLIDTSDEILCGLRGIGIQKVKAIRYSTSKFLTTGESQTNSFMKSKSTTPELLGFEFAINTDTTSFANEITFCTIRQYISNELLSEAAESGIELGKIQVEELNLTTAMTNALINSNIHNLEQLLAIDTQKLYRLRHFGPRTIEKLCMSIEIFLRDCVDLKLKNKVSLEEMKQQYNYQFPNMLNKAHAEFETFKNLSIDNNILLPEAIQRSFEIVTGTKLTSIRGINNFKILRIESVSNDDLDTLRNKLGHLRKIEEWIQKGTLCKSVDDEINQIIEVLSDKEIYILLSRFGYKALTLDQVGKKYGLSRERIRQLETKIKGKLINLCKRMPSLNYSRACLSVAQTLGENLTGELWINNLLRFGLIADKSIISFLFAINKATDNYIYPLSPSLINAITTDIPPRSLNVSKNVLIHAKKICKFSGAVNIKDLLDYEDHEIDIKNYLFLNEFTEIAPGWFSKSIEKTVIEHVINKLLFYCGKITAVEMREAIEKYLYRYRFAAPPTAVIIRLVEKNKNYIISNNTVSFATRPSRKPGLNGPEIIFQQMLAEDGPVLPFEYIFNKITSKGYKGVTVSALLKYSPLVKKITFALYTGFGKNYTSEDIDKAESMVTKVKRYQSVRMHQDGIIEYITNIVSWTLYGDSTDCTPIAQLQGDWPILNVQDSKKITVKGNFISGLLELVSILNLKLGDKIKIEFNTWNRAANIYKVQ